MSVWFITGSSRGFGRELVRAALDAGHQVVATARRPEQLAEFSEGRGEDGGEGFGDRVLLLPLDVTDPNAARTALEKGVERFGRLDVIVNNAGYANVAPIETGDPADFRTQFETNFWGVYNVSRAAIPVLRAQGGGLIVQFSSIGGRVGGAPGVASYQAAKFAVDGFSRSLRAEVGQFGIGVLVVEPSGFATDWAGPSMAIGDIPPEYDAVIGGPRVRDRDDRSSGYYKGDPARAAQIIVQTVGRGHLPSHLLLGVNAVEGALAYSQRQIDEAMAWRPVSRSADFAEPYPAPFPPDDASQ